MWFITLLVLAVAAALIIKAVKAHSDRQSASIDDQPSVSGLHGSLRRPEPSDSAVKPPATSATPPSVSQPGPADAATTGETLDQGSTSTTLDDIREMIKTLNLADSDSPRLGISRDEFNALRMTANSDTSTPSLPDSRTQADIAERLRRMLN